MALSTTSPSTCTSTPAAISSSRAAARSAPPSLTPTTPGSTPSTSSPSTPSASSLPDCYRLVLTHLSSQSPHSPTLPQACLLHGQERIMLRYSRRTLDSSSISSFNCLVRSRSRIQRRQNFCSCPSCFEPSRQDSRKASGSLREELKRAAASTSTRSSSRKAACCRCSSPTLTAARLDDSQPMQAAISSFSRTLSVSCCLSAWLKSLNWTISASRVALTSLSAREISCRTCSQPSFTPCRSLRVSVQMCSLLKTFWQLLLRRWYCSLMRCTSSSIRRCSSADPAGSCSMRLARPLKLSRTEAVARRLRWKESSLMKLGSGRRSPISFTILLSRPQQCDFWRASRDTADSSSSSPSWSSMQDSRGGGRASESLTSSDSTRCMLRKQVKAGSGFTSASLVEAAGSCGGGAFLLLRSSKSLRFQFLRAWSELSQASYLVFPSRTISLSRSTISSHSAAFSRFACSSFEGGGGGALILISISLEDIQELDRLSTEFSSSNTLDSWALAAYSFAFIFANSQFCVAFSYCRSSLALAREASLAMIASQSCSHRPMACWLLSRKDLAERCRASLVRLRASICRLRLLLAFLRKRTSRCSLFRSWGSRSSSSICRRTPESFSDGTQEESPRALSPSELWKLRLASSPLAVSFRNKRFSFTRSGPSYGLTSSNSPSFPFSGAPTSTILRCRLTIKLAFSSSRADTCSISSRFHSSFCVSSSLRAWISRSQRLRSPSFMRQRSFSSRQRRSWSRRSATCSSRCAARSASASRALRCWRMNWTMSCASSERLDCASRRPPSPSSKILELLRLTLAMTSRKADFSRRIISRPCSSSFRAATAPARSCRSRSTSASSRPHSSRSTSFSCASSTSACRSWPAASSSPSSSMAAVSCPNLSMMSVTILTSSACREWSISKISEMLLLRLLPLMAMPSSSSHTSRTLRYTFSPCRCAEMSVPISSRKYRPMRSSTCENDSCPPPHSHSEKYRSSIRHSSRFTNCTSCTAFRLPTGSDSTHDAHFRMLSSCFILYQTGLRQGRGGRRGRKRREEGGGGAAA